MRIFTKFAIAVTATVSSSLINELNSELMHDYSTGDVPMYFHRGWVTNNLESAGLAVPGDPEEIDKVVDMEPTSPGIPGGSNTSVLMDGKKALTRFVTQLKTENKYDILRERAKMLDPPIPWLVLALYHRGMLQRARNDWATARLDQAAELETVEAINDRYQYLRKIGLKPRSWIIDAGCGWGRLGRLILSQMDSSGRYMALDIDRFELRAFIQFELGMEQPKLARKQPIILQSSSFEFGKLLDRANFQDSQNSTTGYRLVDMVVFSAVLKPTMPVELREMAVCNAANALRVGGMLAIFNDCANHDLNMIIEKTGAFEQRKTKGINNCFLERNSRGPLAC